MPKPKRPRLLTATLVVIAVAGAASSLYYGQRLRKLQHEKVDLARQVGLLDVTDPQRVHIQRVPYSDSDPPPGIEAAYVWRYRLYLPANYGACWMSRSGAIAADSPRNRGGGGSSWGATSKDPEETQLTIALLKSDGRWMISRITDHSASTSSLSGRIEFDTLDDLIIRSVVDEATPAKSFSVHDPICLLRIRSKEPAESKKDDLTLYPGVAYYLVESNRRDDFERLANGKIDEMPEPIQ